MVCGMHSNECKTEDDAHETRPSSSSSANESSDNRALSDNRASMYEQPRQSMISKSSARAGLLCVVCADRASGYHYGVPSCEGCKAFFKRSLQLKQMNYKCPASNNCTIDKMSRKCCQACRLAKCHAVGMSKDYLGNKIKRPRPKDGDGKGKYKRSASNSAKECLESVLTPAEIEYESTIQHLITLRNSEPETLVLESQEAHAKFSDAIGKDLIKIIDWAKEIAGYNQLVLSDQAVLLQNNWMDMLVLDWMTRSISDPQSLMLANNFCLNAQEARALGLEEIFTRTMQLLQRLSCFGLTEEEMCCLKAISLTNPDLTKSPEAVRVLNERFTSSLQYFTRNRHRSKPLKFAKLVLALPQVKSIASSLLDLLTEFIKERRPLFSDLLVEMLEAKQRL